MPERHATTKAMPVASKVPSVDIHTRTYTPALSGPSVIFLHDSSTNVRTRQNVFSFPLLMLHLLHCRRSWRERRFDFMLQLYCVLTTHSPRCQPTRTLPRWVTLRTTAAFFFLPLEELSCLVYSSPSTDFSAWEWSGEGFVWHHVAGHPIFCIAAKVAIDTHHNGSEENPSVISAKIFLQISLLGRPSARARALPTILVQPPHRPFPGTPVGLTRLQRLEITSNRSIPSNGQE